MRKTRLIGLPELRSHEALADMVILRRGNRLSISPVTPAQWTCVLGLAKMPAPASAWDDDSASRGGPHRIARSARCRVQHLFGATPRGQALARQRVAPETDRPLHEDAVDPAAELEPDAGQQPDTLESQRRM